MKKLSRCMMGIALALTLIIEGIPANMVVLKLQAAETVTEVVVASPTFSKESGNYSTGFDLSLTAEAGTTIYYSTDGSVPSPERLAEGDANIFTYTAPIQIKDRTGEANVLATAQNAALMTQTKPYAATDDQVAKSTVIRAMAVDANGNCSEVATKTYFVGSNLTTNYKDIAVMSLVTDPKNLMDDDIGIFVDGNNENYKQHGREWEREAYVDFYDSDGVVDFGSNVGIRVRGNYTRQFQQKSLNVYFREEYGQKNLKYELLPGEMNYEGTEKIEKYKNFMLRNGGNDVLSTKMRDIFIQSLVRDRNFTTQNYRTCIVYLNGEYWGVYNIQEKYDDNWMEAEFGINKDNLVIIKDGEVDEGLETDIELYNELRDMGVLNMAVEENYQKFLDAVDLQSYLDYYAVETLINNKDWGLSKNNQFWRSRVKGENKYEDTKWRWMLHDTDHSMWMFGQGFQSEKNDSFAWMDEEGEDGLKNDPLFLAVMENDQFKQAFVNTVMDLLNENMNYEKHLTKYEDLEKIFKTIMPEQNLRFGNDWGQTTMSCFNDSVKAFKDAWKNMDTRMKSLLRNHFNARTRVTVTVDSGLEGQDSLKVNTLDVDLNETENGWEGTYYYEYPISVTAPEVAGYEFAGWEIVGGTATDSKASDTMIIFDEKTVSVKATYKVKIEQDSSNSDSTVNTNKNDVNESEPTPEVVKPKKATIKKLSSPKKRTMQVKIKKISADGYQVVYAKNKKFTKGLKKKNTKKTTMVIKKLKRKTKYYVKVRAYRIKTNGKKVYGKFSKVKRIKIK